MTSDLAVRPAVELLQFTDIHMVSHREEALWGINTYQTFLAVINTAFTHYPAAQFVVLTGDLVHEPTAESYNLIREALASIEVPIYWLPGNHDDSKLITDVVVGNNVKVDRSISLSSWQVVLLDSNAPAAFGGSLDKSELVHLEQCLASHPDRYVIVSLHHHPVPINSTWMDAMALENPQDLFNVLDRYPHVRGVIWGHIHQEFVQERNGVQLLGAPSTCLQFKPGCKDFEKDDIGPGFRWLKLHPNGKIETRVHYLGTSTPSN